MKLINLIRLLFKYGIDQSQYMLENYDQIVKELIENDAEINLLYGSEAPKNDT